MTENDVQQAIVDYCHTVLPEPWIVFAVPNKVPRGKSGRALSGCPGMLPGVSDLILIGPRIVLCAELKRPASPGKREGSLSPAQVAFLDRVRVCGFHGAVWRGIDDARLTFSALGVKTREAMQ
jgi:hypothetical protein